MDASPSQVYPTPQNIVRFAPCMVISTVGERRRRVKCIDPNPWTMDLESRLPRRISVCNRKQVGLFAKLLTRLTRVDANAQLQLKVWQMTHTKHDHVTEELQCHAGYLTCVLDTVQHGATADNYVCITNRLHLTDITSRCSDIKCKARENDLTEAFPHPMIIVLLLALLRSRNASWLWTVLALSRGYTRTTDNVLNRSAQISRDSYLFRALFVVSWTEWCCDISNFYWETQHIFTL